VLGSGLEAEEDDAEEDGDGGLLAPELAEEDGAGGLLAPELEELAGGLTVTEPDADEDAGGAEAPGEAESVLDELDEAPGEAGRSVLDELDDEEPGAGATALSRVVRSVVDELLEAPVPAPVLLLPRSCPHAASAAAMAETAQTLANIRSLCSMCKLLNRSDLKKKAATCGRTHDTASL
jgi:hypothetical protein